MTTHPAKLFKTALVPLLLTLCLTAAAFAEPLRPEQVPEPLKPWISWVLHDRQEAVCPALWNDAGERRCLCFQEAAPPDASAEERLNLQVFRKPGDSVPVTLTTRLVLDVSGPSRELTFGQILPADFVAVFLQTDLPTRSTA